MTLVVTGAGGRLGRMLRAVWPAGAPVRWCGRGDWDLLVGPVPDLRDAVVLHLAGVVTGDGLAQNAVLAQAVLDAAQAGRARAVLAMSTAAVYRPGPAPAREDGPADPASAYGAAKLAAEAVLQAGRVPVRILRLGNPVGAQALLAPRPAGTPVVLDPVPGRDGGPLRSWIGPVTLARVLADLATRPEVLPEVLNVASDPPLPMADLLRASGLPWRYGPPDPAVTAVATLCLDRLQGLHPLPPTTADDLIAELQRARGAQP